MTFCFRLLILTAVFSLGACSLFGQGPTQHTTVDYESLEPRQGHGASGDESYRYGHTDAQHSGTGIDDED